MWSVTINRAGNGFRMNWEEEGEDGMTLHQEEVIQDDEQDELHAGEELLWWVMNYFDLGGSKFDKKRLGIARRQGEKYEPPEKAKNEKA